MNEQHWHLLTIIPGSWLVAELNAARWRAWAAQSNTKFNSKFVHILEQHHAPNNSQIIVFASIVCVCVVLRNVFEAILQRVLYPS